jgi:LemA protein
LTNKTHMKKGTLIIIGLVIILGVWMYSSYNKIVSLNQQADAQWANVETQYQRRFDLIPNLVNTVKGILGQEQKVFGDIAAARTQYAGATTPDAKAAAASNVESSLGKLLVIVENYPQLASSQNVAGLMDELAGTENRVSVERTRFNSVILSYNTAVSRFPTNIMARLFGYSMRSYFQADPAAATAPVVNFQ